MKAFLDSLSLLKLYHKEPDSDLKRKISIFFKAF